MLQIAYVLDARAPKNMVFSDFRARIFDAHIWAWHHTAVKRPGTSKTPKILAHCLKIECFNKHELPV